ncbi:hypothetical protein IscW_ISCW004143 [Ixodes scapularis]|uniref:Uncharacterized protein n=1 Tax=Ixodes scapularis TaxID=6945 RepID=B7PGL0_IXOSC|nr:hypothetical protein IscW_ISCW004143 [Ixodes scapularis]|eukprot:XP_002400910.1 hypothetical protein IscW_ISCW004143 [Ixodes scapularis]
MPNHDSEVFHLAQGPFPTATAGKRLPCWCRGRERAPLKSLPIFQFLEAQYEANGLGKRITQMVKNAVQSNAKTRGPQFQGKKTTSLPARVPTKKPSFNPAEFTQADSLEWGASWANARDRGQNSASSEEDDGAELSDEECATVTEKRALAQELHDAMESDTPEGSLSSLSESLAGEAVSEGCLPPRSFRVAILPESTTEERICEILTPFSEACSVAPTPGSGGH